MGQIRFHRLIPFLIIVSFFLIITINRLNSYYEDAITSHNGLYTIILILLICHCSWRFKRTTIDKIAVLFCVLCIPSLIISSNNLISFVSNVTVVLAVPAGLALGKLLYYWQGLVDGKDMILLIFILPLFYSILYVLFGTSTSISEVRDSVFLICCFIPFVILLNTNIKYIILIVLLYLVLLSAKRSGILYIGVILAALIIRSVSNGNHKIVNNLKIGLSILIIGYVGLSLIGDDYISILGSLERFQGMTDDGGSGRTDYYAIILYSFSTSDIFTQLFGHGLHSVASIIGRPAHNDILEILFDCGIIPVLFFLLVIIINLINSIKHLVNKQFRKDAICQVGIVTGYLILSLMNCMITNPVYYMLLFAAINYYNTEFNNSNYLK